MTASKSSRARQARAQRSQASTASTAGTRNAGAARNGGAGQPGTLVKASTLVKATEPAKTRSVVKGGGAVKGAGAVKGGRDGGRSREQSAVAELSAPTTTTVPLWFQLVTWALSLAGLGVSIYLTIAHFTDKPLAGCSESGLVNCTKVTTSPQSYVFGIPVAVLGLAFFVGAVALMSPWAWRWARREVALIRLASLVVAVGFVLYLLYAELFIIGSICLYCTSVHAITFLLFVLTAFAAAAWGLPKRQRG
jgi:uncharacterized membrane protein